MRVYESWEHVDQPLGIQYDCVMEGGVQRPTAHTIIHHHTQVMVKVKESLQLLLINPFLLSYLLQLKTKSEKC